MSADAGTEAAPRPWDGRLRQRAHLLHRVVLEMWYYRGPGNGSGPEDWTRDPREAVVMDFIEGQRMADKLGHGYYPALVTGPPPDAGHVFFERMHHDRAAEAARSARPVSTLDALRRWEDAHDA